jgi:hypothetical protein
MNMTTGGSSYRDLPTLAAITGAAKRRLLQTGNAELLSPAPSLYLRPSALLSAHSRYCHEV